MKATPAGNAKIGTSQDVETTDSLNSFDFIRKGLRFFFPLQGVKDALLSDDALLINALKGACEKAAYRNAGEKNALPDEGIVDLALFISTVKGFAFRGEEKPSKEDKKEAEQFAKQLTSKTVKAETMLRYFTSKGQTLPDLELGTLELALMRIRLDAAEKAKAEREAEIEAMMKG